MLSLTGRSAEWSAGNDSNLHGDPGDGDSLCHVGRLVGSYLRTF